MLAVLHISPGTDRFRARFGEMRGKAEKATRPTKQLQRGQLAVLAECPESKEGCLMAGYIRTCPSWALQNDSKALEKGGLQALPPPIDSPLRFAEAMSELVSTDELEEAQQSPPFWKVAFGPRARKMSPFIWSNQLRRLSTALNAAQSHGYCQPVAPSPMEPNREGLWVNCYVRYGFLAFSTPEISTTISYIIT
jgi:hypothetical protein